jgi:hypothetical protein
MIASRAPSSLPAPSTFSPTHQLVPGERSTHLLTIRTSPDSASPKHGVQKEEQPTTAQKLTLGSNTHPLEKREPAPYIFELGRTKGYYELNGERATDHLYDIKDEKALGKEVVNNESEALMGKIWNNIDGSRKKVDGH